MIESLQKLNAIHLKQIQHHAERLQRAKQRMIDYSNQLNLLDQSLDFLIESALVPITTSDSLCTVKRELNQAVTDFHLHRERVSSLAERVSFHSDFLDEARRKYELAKRRVVSHAWYPWSPFLAVLVLVISIAVYCYCYYYM
ncbi:hypothetical protein K501DRAFT_281270 [Backusella circina FSU 941]|nr:hypothetical protein K501DRAFT_281270 [Backusella circina FSU 941]